MATRGSTSRLSPFFWTSILLLCTIAAYTAGRRSPLEATNTVKGQRSAPGVTFESRTLAAADPSAEYEEETGSAYELAMQLPSWAMCSDGRCMSSRLRQDLSAVKEFTSNSLMGEDKFIVEKLFYGMVGGFYLEMGALDGVKISNTHWLAQAANWRGLLIEPNPGKFGYPELVQNRKESICVNAAICSTHQRVHFISNGAMSGIYEFMSEAFVQKWYPNRTSAIDLPEIPCIPLMSILRRLGITTIDLWSLDVEGAELEVLKTVNFTEVKVNAIVVETRCYNREKDQAVIQLLENAGFQLFHHDTCSNAYLVNKTFLPFVQARPGGGD